MEERIGKRVNVNRTEEAIATLAGRGRWATAPRRHDRRRLPVLPHHDLRRAHPEARARATATNVEIQDVSQMLLAAVKRGDPHTNGSPRRWPHPTAPSWRTPHS